MSELRIRLIERVCRLQESNLVPLESFLDRLDQSATDEVTPGRLFEAIGAHKDWPRAPVHRLTENGTFIVTAATLNKEHVFRGESRLSFLQDELLRAAGEHKVTLEAWAVFSNHYHFVAHTNGVNNPLPRLIKNLHAHTASEVNRQDGAPGRVIWFNYWDTALTFENSYFARLNYVHQNPVKHGLVARANEYPWCSAGWFERFATKAQVKTIYSFKTDRIQIEDDYQPVI